MPLPFPYNKAGSPTPTDETIEAWEARYSDARRARRRYEAMWHLCQSYVAGRQWVMWDKRDRRVVREPNPTRRERHTVNVLTAYLMTQVGKLVSDDLQPELIFNSDGVEARNYAKQANLAMRYAWDEELDADQILYEAFTRTAVHGLAAIHACWDATSGPLIQANVPYQDGKAVLDPEAARGLMEGGPREDVSMRDVRGRLRWRGYSAWNILPPPGVEHERDFPWLLIEEAVSIPSLRLQYGDKVDGLAEERLNAVDLNGGSAGNDEDDGGAAGVGSPSLKGHVVRKTGYEMPTREHPKGRMFVWAGDTRLESSDSLPLVVNGEPHIGIRFLKWYALPGRFFPMGMIEPGIGPQRQRNRSRSQWIEWKDRAGLGRVYTRPGALSVQQLEGGKIAEVIEVRQGMEFPVETQGLAPGGWLAEDVQMHDTDLERVMGVGEVSLGSNPSGVSAYSAMALLSQQDDNRIKPVIRSLRNEIAWLVKYSLSDMARYWGPQKQVVLAGEDGATQAFIFNATKLPPSVFVRVGKGSAAPRNQAAEIQKIFDIYDRSVSSGQPLGVLWLSQSLEAGRALPIPETPQHAQIEKAQVEDLLIARGGAVEVSPIDDHDIHISIHTQAVADHALIEEAADVVRALMEHIAEHEQMKAQGGGGGAPGGGMPGATMPQMQGPMGALGQQGAGAPQPPSAQAQMPPQS